MKKLRFAVLVVFALILPALALAGAPQVEMVFVKGGCYQMGDSNGGSNEQPVHEVCVDDFYIGKYEVTQAQWQAVMGNNPSSFKGDNRPVEQISWHEARDFARQLTQLTGLRYRLPTEAEWEFAARSRGRREAFAGTNDELALGEYAWHTGNSNGQTHPVGQKRPNDLGLYDMSGNVWEWCEDNYAADYYANSPKRNPPGPVSGANRIFRGGSWDSRPHSMRGAFRMFMMPARSKDNRGFRLVLPTVL